MGRRGSHPYLFGIKHSWHKSSFLSFGQRETALRGKLVRSYCALLFSGGEEQSRDCFSLALTQRPTMEETVQIFREEARGIWKKIERQRGSYEGAERKWVPAMGRMHGEKGGSFQY
jgi:hypothetical protein